MGKLSNFPGRVDRAPDAAPGVECGLASASGRREALRLLLSAGGRIADDGQIDEFLRFASRRRINLEHLWVARVDHQIVWAALPILSPGGTALLFIPADRWEAEVSQTLVERVCQWCRDQRVQLAQLLLEPAHHLTRRAFSAQGFREMAELIYLQIMLRRRESHPLLPHGFAWELYSAHSHRRFAAAINASYHQSLDCPALAGMRDIEDVIAGHKAAGEFDPRFWFLLRRHSEPAGVLLVNRISAGDVAELTYLGVPPAARRQGIGTLLVRQSLAAAAEMGVHRLTLAVDSQNAPALHLYFRHGFSRVAAKIAVMRDLREI